MDKQLLEKINNHVDDLINSITEQDKKNLNEGIVQDLSNITGSLQRNRHFNKALAVYIKCISVCNKKYEGKEELDKRNDVYQKIAKNNVSERDFKETRKVDEKILKEDPKKARCIVNCRLSFIKEITELLKKDGNKICKKSKSEEECNKWLENNLPDLETDVEYLEDTLRKINKIDDEKKIQGLLKRFIEKFV